MRTTQAISITLTHDMLDMIKAKVASGEYASESEVIRDGLRTLRARDAAVERWLRQDVMAAHEAYLKGPITRQRSRRCVCATARPSRRPGR